MKFLKRYLNRFNNWLKWNGFKKGYCTLDHAFEHYHMKEEERELFKSLVTQHFIREAVFREKPDSDDVLICGFHCRDIRTLHLMYKRVRGM